MPSYVFQANLKIARAEAGEQIAAFFAHVGPMGIDVTDISFAKTGGGAGTVTITTVQTLTAEQRSHLGVS